MPEYKRLSDDGKRALVYAVMLATNHRERRYLALRDNVHLYENEGLSHEDRVRYFVLSLLGQSNLPDRLTIQEIARQRETSPFKINRQLQQLRCELFGGDLSDSAIYYRLQHRRRRLNRTCAEPDCDNPLPDYATAGRRYCNEHGKGASRARRHRREKEQARRATARQATEQSSGAERVSTERESASHQLEQAAGRGADRHP